MIFIYTNLKEAIEYALKLKEKSQLQDVYINYTQNISKFNVSNTMKYKNFIEVCSNSTYEDLLNIRDNFNSLFQEKLEL